MLFKELQPTFKDKSLVSEGTSQEVKEEITESIITCFF